MESENTQNQYYLPINRTSLAHYLQKGIILPSRHYNNRGEDIQSAFGDSLLLSDFQFINDSDCSIELILTEEEAKSVEKTNDNSTVLYNSPIPISRIKNIYFSNEEERKIIIGQINDSSAFINNKIVKVVSYDKYSKKVNFNDIKNHRYSHDLDSAIKKFDQQLGGVAFSRFNVYGKYNKNYFSILSFFNAFIGEEYKNNSKNAKLIEHYNGAFNCKGRSWDYLGPLLYKEVTEEVVLESARKENLTLEKDIAGVFEFNKLNIGTNTYKLAILNTYGSEDSTKRKDINALVSACLNDGLVRRSQEGISLIIGINSGYNSFRNQYKDKIVKFKMDCLLDYYTIESVFQSVINQKDVNEKFNYLDNILEEEHLTIEDIYFEIYSAMDVDFVSHEKTIVSEVKDSVDSGILSQNLFDKIVNFVMNILKKNNEKNVELNKKTTALKEEINEANTNTIKARDDLKEAEDQKLTLNKQISEQNENIITLQGDKQKLQDDLHRQQSEVNNYKVEINDLNKETTVLKEQIDEANTNTLVVRSQLKQAEEEKHLLVNRLEKAKGIFLEQQEKISNLEMSVNSLDRSVSIDLDKMKKQELLDFAAEKGIVVNSRDTVQALKDKINSIIYSES